MNYEIIVGNIGTITATSKQEAKAIFDDYVQQSKTGYGRAAGEPVSLLKDGEVVEEHAPAEQ